MSIKKGGNTGLSPVLLAIKGREFLFYLKFFRTENETMNPKEQLRIIAKGASMLVNENELLLKLEQNRPLTIKLGLDPSAPDIHIGHAVVLRKIKQMQDLGHHAVIVIGDFTGQIGDPTGKFKGRAALSEAQVRENAATYCEQIFHILDREKTTVRFNSEWLAELNFEKIIRLAATTTVSRLLERDDFQNRYQSHTPIGLHEFFYPLMQAYDSVFLKADIELGGTDQTFNILMGRTLQKAMGQEQQIALFMPLLEGLDGIEKMSKSLGNYIGVYERAEIMFKKVMEIPDPLIIKYFELATDVHPDEIETIKKQLAAGENPRDIKYRLAQTITSLYHTREEVLKAMEYYEQAFSQKATPDDIPSLPLLPSTLLEAVPALIERQFIKSKSEFLRLVEQNGVTLNGKKISRDDLQNALRENDVLKIGKKRFIKFISL